MIRIAISGIVLTLAGLSVLPAQTDLSGGNLQPGAALHGKFVSGQSTGRGELAPEAAAVPETLGATLLAGAGFLFMLRRRRFS